MVWLLLHAGNAFKRKRKLIQELVATEGDYIGSLKALSSVCNPLVANQHSHCHSHHLILVILVIVVPSTILGLSSSDSPTRT
jgi:hypothetical protein